MNNNINIELAELKISLGDLQNEHGEFLMTGKPRKDIHNPYMTFMRQEIEKIELKIKTLYKKDTRTMFECLVCEVI